MTSAASELLTWYDCHRRSMPWRTPVPDAYRTWVSEIMLQQTTVATVTTRFLRFMDRFPSVEALAAAGHDEVMEEWAGLGYYARARNLHACAKVVVAEGGFPGRYEELLRLPGVGRYTAAAVAAIAFNQPVIPVDGNVERVTARIYSLSTPMPQARPMIIEAAQAWMMQPAARERPGDFVQALFDLGAMVCTPRRPACSICPWRDACAAHIAGVAEELPRKPPKPQRPQRYGVHYLARDALGRVLVRRRPPEGLLGGMLEIPGTPWRDRPWLPSEALAHAPLPGASWVQQEGTATHLFTHFALEMRLCVATVPELAAPAGMELRPAKAATIAMPTAMRKVMALA